MSKTKHSRNLRSHICGAVEHGHKVEPWPTGAPEDDKKGPDTQPSSSAPEPPPLGEQLGDALKEGFAAMFETEVITEMESKPPPSSD